MAEFIKQLWSDAIIATLYENQSLNTMFNRALESYVRSQGGNKIILPILASGGTITRTDALTVGAGLPLTVNDITKTATELIIYEYTYGPVLLRKLDEIQANTDLFNKAKDEVAQAFIEHIFTAVITNLINNMAAGNKLQWSGGMGGNEFTFKDLVAMQKKLDDNKILQDGRYCAICTDAKFNLGSDTNLTNWFAVNQAAVQSGQLPSLAGFGFAPSTLVPLTTAAGAIDVVAGNNTQKNVVAWRKNHLDLVIQTEMEITATESAPHLGTLVSFTDRYGILLERSIGAVQSTQQ